RGPAADWLYAREQPAAPRNAGARILEISGPSKGPGLAALTSEGGYGPGTMRSHGCPPADHRPAFERLSPTGRAGRRAGSRARVADSGRAHDRPGPKPNSRGPATHQRPRARPYGSDFDPHPAGGRDDMQPHIDHVRWKDSGRRFAGESAKAGGRERA